MKTLVGKGRGPGPIGLDLRVTIWSHADGAGNMCQALIAVGLTSCCNVVRCGVLT